MALFRYFSGVRLIKVSFKVNKGNKFGDFSDCPLNRGCPLNTGFTIHSAVIWIIAAVSIIWKGSTKWININT